MKIAVVSAQVFICPPPGYSGLEMIAWQVAKGLAARGHEVGLFAPEGSSCPKCTVIPTGPPGQWDEGKAFSQYWPQLMNYDVIIDHSWSKFSYRLKMEGRLKAPVLGVWHAPVDTMYKSLPPISKPCFTFISDDQRSHFEALFSPAKGRTAYNGIDLNFYKPIKGIKRTNRFLFLARFSSIKGPDIAIETCKKVGVGLDLIGDTSITNEPELFKKCKDMCDGEQIKIIGPATRGECVYYFSRAHALLHPNLRFREPFGLSPVEAMGCGCPVIAFDLGAMRETVGDTGWLVHTVEQFEADVKQATMPVIEQMRPECIENAKKFSVENMAARYEELCTEAVQTGGW